MNEMAHFQESRVDPAAGQSLDFIDALVGGDEGEPLLCIPSIHQVVEHLYFPFGITLNAQVVDDEEGDRAQSFHNGNRLAMDRAVLIEGVSQGLEKLSGEADEPARLTRMEDELVQGNTAEHGFSVSRLTPEEESPGG